MNHVLLDLGQENTLFLCEDNKGDNSKIVINIGYQKIIDRHFKQSLPSANEIEAAIITIEDAIESIHKQWVPIKHVFVKNAQLNDIAKFIKADNILTSDKIENGFNRIADIIMGSPKKDNEFPDSLVFISSLIIVRELIHHLQIEDIRII